MPLHNVVLECFSLMADIAHLICAQICYERAIFRSIFVLLQLTEKNEDSFSLLQDHIGMNSIPVRFLCL